jgi:hypothetical protein
MPLADLFSPRARPVLFLDFDGVLHPAGVPTINSDGDFVPDERLFLWRANLESELRAHPELRIVISSDWRKYHAEEDLVVFLGPELGRRVVGVMPYFERGSRAEAVRAEAARRGVRHWLALDDHDSVHAAREQGDNRFVACRPDLGIACQQVRRELARQLAWLNWLAQQSSLPFKPSDSSHLPVYQQDQDFRLAG